MKTAVLVVDDDRAIREMLETALDAKGYLVWTFETLGEFADRDYPSFCCLVEDLYALGVSFSADLMDRAQMRPVDELLT